MIGCSTLKASFKCAFFMFNKLCVLAICFLFSSAYADVVTRDSVLTTMEKSSRFMMEKVSYQGGFVWSYLPDFSRQWGELEARRTMIWLQPPGTATVGHVLLDAYHATGDEYYINAAEQVAAAIVHAQLPSGGWNYVADFAGEKSLRKWYDTIGRNAWRLEEFQIYYGNATFDDGGTIDAATFLLRMDNEKPNSKYRPALNKAIDFVLKSQYPIGGWPQRFPPRKALALKQEAFKQQAHKQHFEYSSFITFNDDVADKNIGFLLLCNQVLGDARLLEPINRAMNAYIALQMKPPQAGWALQYDLDFLPAAARSFEPKSIAPGTTADNIVQLIKFYRLTGEQNFLTPIPAALAWLETTKLPSAQIKRDRAFAGNVEVGSGKFLYTHRRGSNVANGEYYVDYNSEKTLAHYGSTRHIDIESLHAAYDEALHLLPKELAKQSPLENPHTAPLPKFFTLGEDRSSDLNFRAQANNADEKTPALAQRLVASLNREGYWPTPLIYTSNPYKGAPPRSAVSNDDRYAQTMVGDEWDTSPYPTDTPAMGISTGVYIKNMSALIRYLLEAKQ